MVSQKVIMRGMIGYQIGILIGLFGGMIVILLTSQMNIWLKVFTVIGLFSASIGTLYSVWETIKAYNTFVMIENLQEYKDIREVEENGKSSTTI
jgi:hypothetical protein